MNSSLISVVCLSSAKFKFNCPRNLQYSGSVSLMPIMRLRANSRLCVGVHAPTCADIGDLQLLSTFKSPDYLCEEYIRHFFKLGIVVLRDYCLEFLKLFLLFFCSQPVPGGSDTFWCHPVEFIGCDVRFTGFETHCNKINKKLLKGQSVLLDILNKLVLCQHVHYLQMSNISRRESLFRAVWHLADDFNRSSISLLPAEPAVLMTKSFMLSKSLSKSL